MKLANCLRILLTVAFVVGVLSSTHAGQKTPMVSPDAGTAEVQPDASKVTPAKVVPGKEDQKALPEGTMVIPEKKKVEIKQPQKPTLPVKCNGKIVTILGTSGVDFLNGTDGPDVIHGLGDNDIIRGMGGDDTICGGDGDDKLDGGSGNDTLDGGPGNDECINGPSGKGFLVAPKNCEKQIVAGVEGTKKGSAKPEKGGGFVPKSKTEKAIPGGPTNMVPRDVSSGGSGFVSKGNKEQVNLPKCNGQTPTIFGTSGDDTFYGTQEADVIHGLGGNDKINGLGGDDVICGGDGNDEIEGADGNDSLYGGKGDDHLWGSDGEDNLFGGEGKDRLEGFEGNDYLNAGPGNDWLDGGPGNDKLAGVSGSNWLVGGPGNDKLYGGTGNDHLFGDTGDDELYDFGGGSSQRGGEGNDRLTGSDDFDSLEGGPGDDELYGRGGNDWLFGGGFNQESSGNDFLYGGDGNDWLNSAKGNTNSNSEVYGGNGDDNLYGRISHKLDGGPGNDTCIHEGTGTGFVLAPINCEGLKPKTTSGSKFKAGAQKESLKRKFLPKIDEISATKNPIGEGGEDRVSPLGRLYIKGSHFGTQKGTIHLSGDFGTAQLFGKDVTWESETQVNGRIPWITDVKDHVLVVQVETADGSLSNKANFAFLATRETIYLKYGDPAVKVISCASDGCDFISNSGYGGGSFTFGGSHTTEAETGEVIGEDLIYHEGTDQFEIVLKNGWVVASGFYTYKYLSSSNEELSGPTPPPNEEVTWSPEFKWVVSPWDIVSYRYRVIIRGPRGVPHH